MLFYERRKSIEKASPETASCDDATYAKPSTSCSEITCETNTINEATTSANEGTNIKTDPHIELLKSNLETQTKTRQLCDIVSKDRTTLANIEDTISADTTINKQNEPPHIDEPSTKTSTTIVALNRLNKELEDWIWQDNRHFLQDRNVFEHTYFK